MKSIKGLSMNKMLGGIRKRSSVAGPPASEPSGAVPRPGDSPEATAHNTVKAFCESGGNIKGDEVLFLPAIVEAAESSPAAAAESARIIRKFIGKEYLNRPTWQYNAIMLVRILTDNPGKTFTRNLDQKFTDAARSLLRHVRDRRVRQILMETLEDFQYSRMDDENLVLIVEMWKVEKEKALKEHGNDLSQFPPRVPQRPVWFPAPANQHSQNYFARSHSSNRLPDTVELASRLEEARTSAKLLEQVVMNTPPGEFLSNDLIREFSDRCQSASRSIQGYMSAENPAPDNDTMESLIDTNEQLQTALNQHQRAVLSARKQVGLNESTDGLASPPLGAGQNGRPREWQHSSPTSSGSGGPQLPTRKQVRNGKGKATESYSPSLGPPPAAQASGSASASGSRSNAYQRDDDHDDDPPQNPFEDDPFRDPQPRASHDVSSSGGVENQLHAQEPFHPGFSAAKGKARHDPAFGDSDDDDLYSASRGNQSTMH